MLAKIHQLRLHLIWKITAMLHQDKEKGKAALGRGLDHFPRIPGHITALCLPPMNAGTTGCYCTTPECSDAKEISETFCCLCMVKEGRPVLSYLTTSVTNADSAYTEQCARRVTAEDQPASI